MNKPTCSVDGCMGQAYCRSWCTMHYTRWRSTGDPLAVRRPRIPCSIEGCDQVARSKTWCQKHYSRWRFKGDPLTKYANRPKPPKVNDGECSIGNCAGRAFRRTWCSTHYHRWKRYDDPLHRYPGDVLDGKRICSMCSVDTPLVGFRGGYCIACSNAFAKEWQAARAASRRVPKSCENCGTIFQSDGARTKYCSRACYAAMKVKVNEPNVLARRALERGATVEKFFRSEIFDRDGWICGLCGGSIDPILSHPNPMSASLDHVHPISRGGDHSRLNTQAAHLVCNLRKSNKVA